jgi:hypothetical protein
VEKKNKDQKQLLTKEAGQNGEQAKQETAKVNNPQLNQLLTERGVNSEDFNQRLASGQLTDPEEILRAVGDTSEMTQEDLVQAETLAEEEMKIVFSANPEPHEAKIADKLITDESNQEKVMVTEANSTIRGDQTRGSGTKEGSDRAASHQGSGAISLSGLASANVEKKTGTQDEVSVMDPSQLLRNIFSQIGGNGSGKGVEFSLLPPFDLRTIGVLKVVKGQNIFHVARRYFRSFGKWRRNQSLKYSMVLPKRK